MRNSRFAVLQRQPVALHLVQAALGRGALHAELERLGRLAQGEEVLGRAARLVLVGAAARPYEGVGRRRGAGDVALGAVEDLERYRGGLGAAVGDLEEDEGLRGLELQRA